MAKLIRKPAIKSLPPQIKLRAALKITGFVLCEFKSDGEDECEQCFKPIKQGHDVYYSRTCYEVDEGAYFCKKCTLNMPETIKKEMNGMAAYFQSDEFKQELTKK